MATLKQLKTFIAVAECKQMSMAARKLYISQPTISQIIADLETEYQVTLFQRLPKELRITPAGQLLLTSARQIIDIQRNLEENMKDISSRQFLRVGATLTIGNTLLATLISNLETAYPDMEISVFVDNTSTLEQRLLNNELDIALVEGIIKKDSIFTFPAINDRLELICGSMHPFFEKESVTINDLQNQSFIMREKGSGTRAIFESIMLANQISYKTKWECNSGVAIIEAVRHNLGLGMLSYRCVPEYVARGEIRICPIRDISFERYFYICYNRNHIVTPQIQIFIDETKKMQMN